jgi:hypothetical protein
MLLKEGLEDTINEDLFFFTGELLSMRQSPINILQIIIINNNYMKVLL